jgi:hypothetical protein
MSRRGPVRQAAGRVDGGMLDGRPVLPVSAPLEENGEAPGQRWDVRVEPFGGGLSDDGSMDGQVDRTNDIEILKMVQTHFLQDLRLFWVRSNMYLLTNGALVSVFASVASRRLPAAMIAGFGLVVSIFWLIVARASYQWLGIWRRELCKLDEEVDRFQVLARIEQAPLRAIQSPSRVTQWLPLVVGLGWVFILGGTAVAALR